MEKFLMENDSIIFDIAIIVAALLIAWILNRVKKNIFKRLREKKPGIEIRFVENVITAVIYIACIIMAFSLIGGVDSMWKSLLGGTAIVSAVLVFVAQDVIKDALAGLMISIFKPFEIGSRIELEDGTAGVVKDISMRHIVLKTWDAQMLIIPNSKMNELKIWNDSYNTNTKSVQFHFYVAYNTDVEKAMEIIRNTVISSPYSIPGKETPNGMDFGPVYFMAYEESSLHLATTVWFEQEVPTEVVKSDINLRVNKAFAENGIEIPYQYVNVIQKK